MLTVNAFDSIKEILRIADVAAFYGVAVKRHNKALCPFHNEKTPSFTIYPKTSSFMCFGCGVGGSVIDFVMQMYGLDALGAAKKLDLDYNLGLFEYRASKEEVYRLSEQQAQRQADKGLTAAFERYINRAYSLLCDYLHLLQNWKVIYAPKNADDVIHDLFAEACHRLDYIEYLVDCLLSAGVDEQIQFYEMHRKEMFEIASRVKLYTNSGNADESA